MENDTTENTKTITKKKQYYIKERKETFTLNGVYILSNK